MRSAAAERSSSAVLRAELERQRDALEVADSLARLMATHPQASVRAYGTFLRRALADPIPWRTAVVDLVAEDPRDPARPLEHEISEVIANFVMQWSAELRADADRLFGPLAAAIATTRRDPQREDARAWLCADWSARHLTAFWLRAVGLDRDAGLLAACPPMRARSTMTRHLEPILDPICASVLERLTARRRTSTAPPRLISAAFETVCAVGATGGASAALSVSAARSPLAERAVDALQWLWVFEALEDAATSASRLAALERSVVHLQRGALALLVEMIEIERA